MKVTTSSHATFTIGALSAASGSSVPTIRYYEEIGLLRPAGRRASGHRIFGTTDLQRLVFIRRCRDLGFPIDQVRTLISLNDDPTRDCVEARDLAQIHLDAVRMKLSELRVLEKSLAAFVEDCTAECVGGSTRDCVILEDLAGPRRCCS